MTYVETIAYLDSFINYEKRDCFPYTQSFKLERIKSFLERIGNPQDALRCIHVAGTKGKGSTCAFIAYILKEAGFKVGLYTSPHLSDVRERIRILSRTSHVATQKSEKDFEGMISKKALVALVQRLHPAIDRFCDESEYGRLSFFEVYTAVAFSHFKEERVDFAVLETGLGGRLDATNVVKPLVCAITPISFDHTRTLGTTLRKIATEKAGIIKRQKIMVVSAPQKSAALKVIKDRCARMGARLWEAGKDIRWEKTERGFTITGAAGEYKNLSIRLLGSHQLVNAAVSIGVIKALGFYAIQIDADTLASGLRAALWPGRCEIVSRNPLVVLDGAQNKASSRILKETIKNEFTYDKLILVLGISKDKDFKGISQELAEVADRIVLTKSNNPRAAEPCALARHFNGAEIHVTGDIKEARRVALRLAGKDDMVLVCGSLFVVGEARACMTTR